MAGPAEVDLHLDRIGGGGLLVFWWRWLLLVLGWTVIRGGEWLGEPILCIIETVSICSRPARGQLECLEDARG